MHAIARGAATTWLLVIACALASSCSLLVPARCTVDDECQGDARCLAGECITPPLPHALGDAGQPADGGPDAGFLDDDDAGSADDAGPPDDDGGGAAPGPRIDAVDGDGSLRAVALDADGGAPEGAVLAARRFSSSWRVLGANLSQVTSAELRDDDGDVAFALSLAGGGSDVERSVLLPSGLAAGLFTLVLLSPAGDASAQVLVLQGEPGLSSLTRTSPSVGGAPCLEGGVLLEHGLDADRDGVLDDEEVDPAGSATVCHGERGEAALSCAGGSCTLDDDLVLGGALSVAGDVEIGGLATGAVIADDLRLDVPAEYADVNAALLWLADKRIAGDAVVTIALAPGDHAYSSPITVDHADGRLIVIRGTGGARGETRLTFTGANNGVVVAAGASLGGLLNLTLIDAGAATAGVFASHGSFVWAGPDVEAIGFQYGYIAYSGAMLSASYCYASGNDLAGFSASRGATLAALFAEATGNQYGFVASAGSTLLADSSDAIGNDVSGFHSGRGSYLHAVGASCDALAGVTNTCFHAEVDSTIDMTTATILGSTANVDLYVNTQSIVLGAGAYSGSTPNGGVIYP